MLLSMKNASKYEWREGFKWREVSSFMGALTYLPREINAHGPDAGYPDEVNNSAAHPSSWRDRLWGKPMSLLECHGQFCAGVIGRTTSKNAAG